MKARNSRIALVTTVMGFSDQKSWGWLCVMPTYSIAPWFTRRSFLVSCIQPEPAKKGAQAMAAPKYVPAPR
jgi:hypothetical protein